MPSGGAPLRTSRTKSSYFAFGIRFPVAEAPGLASSLGLHAGVSSLGSHAGVSLRRPTWLRCVSPTA